MGPRKVNAAWHRRHLMPKNPTLEQRLTWHAAHARAWLCRDMPRGIPAKLARRGRK